MQDLKYNSLPGPYLVGEGGGELPPKRSDEVTIMLLKVSSLPPQKKEKLYQHCPPAQNILGMALTSDQLRHSVWLHMEEVISMPHVPQKYYEG